MPGRGLSRWLLAAGLAAAPVAAALTAVVATGQPEAVGFLVPFLAMLAAGAAAHRGRPENLAARRLLLLGTVAVVWMAATVALAVVYRRVGEGPWLPVANAAVQALGLLLPAAIVALLAVYPDGRYQRRCERWVVRAFAGLAAAVPVALLLSRQAVEPAWGLEWVEGYSGAPPEHASPLYVPALGWLGGAAAGYHQAVLALGPAAGAVLLALRYRRFDRSRRVQIKWPLYGAALLAVLPEPVLAWLGVGTLGGDIAEIVLLTLLPGWVLVGLVAPRLFDIELVIRRSLVYGLLWLAIAGAYVGVAAALGIAAGGEGLQVAVAVTIAATLLFDPVRRRLARRAEQFAYGERLTSEELLRRLGAALEHTLEPGELAAALAATIRQGLGASWVRMTVDGLPPVHDGAEPARGEPAAARVPLTFGHERLGTLECGPRSGRLGAPPLPDQLLATLGRQAALAMANARLADRLARRASELAASRARLVHAEETARRRLERDIHDGAQQELVALIARIGIARRQLARDPSLVTATLDELQSEARQALEDLRELARGIHPSVLGDRGIVEAVEARASRLPIGVTIECDPGMREARFADAVEGAVYFVVSEALTNALKHSGADRAIVTFARERARLAVTVADRGAGFDPAATGRSGLAGLADRVEALGGRLEVRSSPGAGTTVGLELPVAERAVA